MKKKQSGDAPKNEAEIIEMGKFYFLNGKYDNAIDEFNKALEINPGNAEVYYHLGLIFENRNMSAEAQDMYEKALSINPNMKLAREHLNKIIGL